MPSKYYDREAHREYMRRWRKLNAKQYFAKQNFCPCGRPSSHHDGASFVCDRCREIEAAVEAVYVRENPQLQAA